MKIHLLIAALFISFFCIQGAEDRPKAPPPVLLNYVPDIAGYASEVSYFTDDRKYRIDIDRNANTVKIFDVSNPDENPVLISTNQYRAEKKEEERKN